MRDRKKQRPGVMIYFEIIPALAEMTDQQVGQFLRAALLYARDNTQPEFSDAALRMVWPMVQARLDADGERYAAVSATNSAKRRYAGYAAKCREGGRDPLPFAEWCESQADNSG